ncbi:protein phosphatase 2C domain-containing protein [Streptomyces sp. NPDC056568]|uniref:protein phosphatase 2C domain-containing protein n=1 Tax=Streptomyces sp. NPDC056568 TaxID=3345866 RepID=UPI0036A134FC
MSQQGGRPTGHDDWWTQLYDDSTDDTGPTVAPDSLDDRFASAAGTVSRGPDQDQDQHQDQHQEQDQGRGQGQGQGIRDGAEPPPPADRTPPPAPAPPAGIPGQPAAGVPWQAATGTPGPAEDRAPWWAGGASPAVPGPRTPGPPRPDGTPRGGGTPGRPGPPPQRAPWEPPPAAPAGPASFPPAPAPTAPPEPAAPPVPPAPPDPPVPPVPSEAPAPPAPPSPAPPSPAPAPPEPHAPSAPPAPAEPPRPAGPRGRTTSGSGAADLREPAADVPAAPPLSGGAPPPPPSRSTPDLPPLPPPFLPSLSPHAGDGGGPGSSARDYVGSRPPTYDAEPTALPAAEPDGLDGVVADTVLDGARYGTCTLRAVSVRGDSARYRGDPRRDGLLVARFGAGEQALVLVAMATGARATAGAHLAAADACRWIGQAVGRSHARLAEDLRAGRRGDLKSGLHRLTDRSLGRLRASAAEQGLAPEEYAATLRCLLLPADPECRTRVFFGVGPGGLLRLRGGAWQDVEPQGGEVTGEPVLGYGSPRGGVAGGAPSETPEGDRLTMDLGVTTPPGPAPEPYAGPRRPFRFRASVARPGDVLLMSTAGLAEPLLSEPELGRHLARRWSGRTPPGLAEFLADAGVRVKGYADDRTAAAVWEA